MTCPRVHGRRRHTSCACARPQRILRAPVAVIRRQRRRRSWTCAPGSGADRTARIMYSERLQGKDLSWHAAHLLSWERGRRRQVAGRVRKAPRRRIPSAGATHEEINNRRKVIRGDRAVILAENDTAAGHEFSCYRMLKFGSLIIL